MFHGSVNDPGIKYMSSPLENPIDTLNKQPIPTSPVNSRWAALDRKIMLQAPWAPFINREFTDFFNGNVDLRCYVNQVVYGFDYATICMK